MPYAGQELEGANGFRLRFHRIEDEVLEMEAQYGGGGPLPPPHLHPRQDERFEVLDGEVRAVVDGSERRYTAGDTFEVPAGTAHQMGADGPARVSWQVRPALNTAGFMEGLHTGAAADDPAAFLARYREEFQLASPPGHVEDSP